MRVLVAPDKFKGTATAGEVAEAMARAVRTARLRPTVIPLADGGEGTLDALGGANRTTTVHGPLGDPVEAGWRISNGHAVIEMARASGLTLAGGPEHNDPINATTSGTGELIDAAREAGARSILVGVGGSATTDGGLGALQAMQPLSRFVGVTLVVAVDVTTTFVDAATVFAAQKGASPAQVELLRRRLESLADSYLDEFGVDVRDVPGSGAAGGLAGGLLCVGGEIRSGFDVVADHQGFYDTIDEFGPGDLVITGEGFVDEESFDGKVVGGVVDAAQSVGAEVLVVTGQVFDGIEARVPVVVLADEVGFDRSVHAPVESIEQVLAAWFANRAVNAAE